MEQAITKFGLFNIKSLIFDSDDMLVLVRVIRERRRSKTMHDFLMAPIIGEGTVWVASSRVRIIEIRGTLPVVGTVSQSGKIKWSVNDGA